MIHCELGGAWLQTYTFSAPRESRVLRPVAERAPDVSFGLTKNGWQVWLDTAPYSIFHEPPM